MSISQNLRILDAYSSIVVDTHDNNLVIAQVHERVFLTTLAAVIMHHDGGMPAIFDLVNGTGEKYIRTHVRATPDNVPSTLCGSGGILELKNKIEDQGQVYIAFCREQVDLEPAFLLINYIPAVSGVKRARALVHSRRLGTIFKHQITVIVNSLDNLILNAVHQALAEPDISCSAEMGRIVSMPVEAKNKALPQPIIVQRRPSETCLPAAFTASPIHKSSSMFSNLLRRRKMPDAELHEAEDLPPTPPPKDLEDHTVQLTLHQHIYTDISTHNYSGAEPISIPRRQRTESLSEFAVISHSNSSDEVLVEPARVTGAHKPNIQSLPLRRKRDPELLDPAARAQRRLEAQQRREMEIENERRQEAERQAERRRRKEQLLKEDEEAEARRKASLEDDLRRVKAERRQRALLEQQEETQRHRELEERKRLDKERRMEEHKRLEEWRREQARMADEVAQREKKLRKQEEIERRRRIQAAEAKIKRNKHLDSMLTGWVTMQTGDSLFWKRRFFKFVGTTVNLSRSPKEVLQVLDTAELYGKVGGIREWNEGYEDLEAIPHSFAVEFVDGRAPWSMFSDSEEEKYKLLGLLYHAAGL